MLFIPCQKKRMKKITSRKTTKQLQALRKFISGKRWAKSWGFVRARKPPLDVFIYIYNIKLLCFFVCGFDSPWDSSPLTYMGVSKDRGTPKSSILIGFSIINHPFWGYHYIWKHPYYKHRLVGIFLEFFQPPNKQIQCKEVSCFKLRPLGRKNPESMGSS